MNFFGKKRKNGPSSGKPIVHYGLNEHQIFIDRVKDIFAR